MTKSKVNKNKNAWDVNDYTDDWVFDEILTDNEDTEEDFVIYKSIKGQRICSSLTKDGSNNYTVTEDTDDPDKHPDICLSNIESHFLDSLFQYHWFLSNTETTLKRINESFQMVSAQELRSYYISRPNLHTYTLTTELHRMQYTVSEGRSRHLTDIKIIRKKYSNREECKIWRAANQSLVADAIKCLTGPDNIIRPQHLASAIADECHFYVDTRNNTVFCECHLVVSLTAPSFRLEIASLQLEIYFALGSEEDHIPPELVIQAVDLTPKPVSGDKFLSVAKILARDSVTLDKYDEICEGKEVCETGSFRDALLVSSMFVNRTMNGVNNAWKQVDSVANVKEKTYKLFSGLLPSADLITSLEQEQHDCMESLTPSSSEVEQESTIHFTSEEETNLLIEQDRAQIISYAACTNEHKQLLIVEEEDDFVGAKKQWRRPLLVRF